MPAEGASSAAKRRDGAPWARTYEQATKVRALYRMIRARRVVELRKCFRGLPK